MLTAMNTEVIIYSDGACSPNPGKGGWGVVLLAPGQGLRKELSGAEADTTNNRMELMAALQGLRALQVPCEVTVRTDSQYLRNAFTKKWIVNWQRNGWRTASKQPVKNQDLWQDMLEQTRKHKVRWEWVKGHDDDEENNRCDELAVQARLGI